MAGFSINFTHNKAYDLDDIIANNSRKAKDSELIMKVVDEDEDATIEGEVLMSQTQNQVSVTKSDIKKYLY